uniref:Astacin domain-containing protein n=1 Tax=Parastrongyloides trichosuri TaxID=131310 RepID=A0A0N4Z2X3_PARTI
MDFTLLTFIYCLLFFKNFFVQSSSNGDYAFETRERNRLNIHANKFDLPISYYKSTLWYEISYKNGDLIVEEVLDEIRNNTCITFEEKLNYSEIVIPEEKALKNGLWYFRDLQNCSINSIGLCNKGKYCNLILLTDDCSEDKGLIRKFTLESLGIVPPHLRNDNAKYINVFISNMTEKGRKIFNGIYVPINLTYGIDYDYSSATHSDTKIYSIDGEKKTVEPKEYYREYYEYMMGQREEATFLDYKLLNLYYCSDKCPKKIECKNSGYQDYNDCTKCICPVGFTGRYCENYKLGPESSCGFHIVYAKDYLQHIDKQSNTFCQYFIFTQGAKYIYISFNSFLGGENYKKCVPSNSIEVRYKLDLSKPGLCLCYTDYSDPELVSEGSKMIVIYNSNFYPNFKYMAVSDSRFSYDKLRKDQKTSKLRDEEEDKKIYKGENYYDN